MNLLNERTFQNDANGFLFAMLITKTTHHATDNMGLVNRVLRDIRFSKENFIETDEDRCVFKMVLANMANNWFGNSFDTYYNGAQMGLFQNPIVHDDEDLENERLFKFDCMRHLTRLMLGDVDTHTHRKVREHVKNTLDQARIKDLKLSGYVKR